MSRYILIHRLRGPAILLLIGVLALLYQMGAIAHFWRLFWPLLLIMLGVLMLAERAAMSEEDFPFLGCGPCQGMNPWGAGPGAPNPAAQTNPPAESSTAIVPANDFGNDLNDRFGNGGEQ